MASRAMPAYSIPEETSWRANSWRNSSAPTASMYSEDFDRLYRASDVPSVQPLRIQKAPSSPPEHAHPQQQIHDYGQKVRTSRLPLFTQVRSMLHKPPGAQDRSVNVRWDEYSGELSADGKAPQVKPSTYKSPYEGTFEVIGRRSPSRLAAVRSTNSLSPVSTLKEDELNAIAPVAASRKDRRADSPVSSVSVSPIDNDLTQRIPLATPEPPHTPPAVRPIQVIKRKPAPAVVRSTPPAAVARAATPSDVPSASPSPAQASPAVHPEQATGSPNPRSRFSWTTYAPSLAPTHPSMDMSNSTYSRPHNDIPVNSRFSWSTWNTGNTPNLRPDSPPPSPPPPLPTKYVNPPVQSILSRARPIQRADREQRPSPPPQAQPTPASSPAPATAVAVALPSHLRTKKAGSPVHTPVATKPKRGIDSPLVSSTTSANSSGAKKLPLPPELQSPSVYMTHLDALRRQQQDLEHQRRNMQKLISEESKSERASPMHLSFADFKDAQRRLAEHKATLDEIQLEEREVGIAISRARRKEGEEEGLWVRRVTS